MADYIKKYDQIETMAGYIVVTEFNGTILYCKEYDVDMDGNSVLKDDDARYTLAEVGHLMKEVDGRNHRVVWEDEETK